MATEDQFGSQQHTVRLDRSDVVRLEDGSFLVPVVLDDEGQQHRGYLTISPDDAARLHAQLDRHLTQGWAMSEEAKVGRQQGEIYPVGGFGLWK